MADEFTTNYGVLLPKTTDTMSQQLSPATPNLVQNIRDAFETWEKAANPDVISVPPLPQSGTYKIGDRVYLSDASYQSSFILISKDAVWGYIWRPVQAAMAPWITVPNTAFSGAQVAGWANHSTKPLQFSLDNKGNCFWRGAIRKSTAGLTNENSMAILATLPNGLKHHTEGMYTLAIDPATPQSTTGIAAYRGGRWYIRPDGYNSFRFHNSDSAQDVYFNGVEYVCSSAFYFDP